MTFFCSDAARERSDSLLGTAPAASRWFLVEQDGAWAPRPLDGVQAPDAARAELAVALDDARARLELIRRPGARTRTDRPLRWAVLDARLGVQVWGERTPDGGWGDGLAALRDPLAHGAEPGGGVLLVCTHGKHDACCARRGRPVAAALAAAFPAETWECSHLGGDRFAANLAVMPDGVLYGMLDPDTAPDVVRAHRAGRPDAATLRGIVALSPAEQAALLAAASELGLVPWDRSLAATTLRDGSAWEIEIRVDGAPAGTVTGHCDVRPPHRLTCGAEPRHAVVPVVDQVRLAPSLP